MGVRGVCGGLRQGRHGGTVNMQATHTNNIKLFHNLHYFFTYGYDVDHPGNTCPVSYPAYNIPNIPFDKAHMYDNQGASMLAQQKSLTDGTGASMGWILTNSTRKEKFLMQIQQEFAKLHQQKKPYHPQQQKYRGRSQNTQQQQPSF